MTPTHEPRFDSIHEIARRPLRKEWDRSDRRRHARRLTTRIGLLCFVTLVVTAAVVDGSFAASRTAHLTRSVAQ